MKTDKAWYHVRYLKKKKKNKYEKKVKYFEKKESIKEW